jgi:hypothetical protein
MTAVWPTAGGRGQDQFHDCSADQSHVTWAFPPHPPPGDEPHAILDLGLGQASVTEQQATRSAVATPVLRDAIRPNASCRRAVDDGPLDDPGRQPRYDVEPGRGADRTELRQKPPQRRPSIIRLLIQ